MINKEKVLMLFPLLKKLPDFEKECDRVEEKYPEVAPHPYLVGQILMNKLKGNPEPTRGMFLEVI